MTRGHRVLLNPLALFYHRFRLATSFYGIVSRILNLASLSHAVYGVVGIANMSEPVHGLPIPMSIRVYSEINLHLTWHTKNNRRLITSEIQPDLYAFLKNKIVETRGAYFHAIGGIDDHVHIGLSVKPSIHLDEWIGQLKGASSYEMGKDLQWQAGYGIVSFGTGDLDWVVAYIRNQKEHHAKGTIHDRLERTEDEKPVNGL